MLKLYQIADHYNTLLDIIDRTDATQDDFRMVLDRILDDFDRKVENIAKLVLDLEASIEAIRNEEARLATRRASLQNKVQWLKDYVLGQMIAVGKDQVKRDTVTVTIRTNPPSVALLDITQLPPEFTRTIPETIDADRKAILEHFKATGEIPPGVDIITDRKRLEIR